MNQSVAFQVSSSYYKLITAQERLQAAEDILKTAQTTQDSAESQLSNGRATRPDVLNARAETAQAMFDRESADGDEKIARVALAETIGVDPSPDVVIDAQKNAPLPESLVLRVDALIDRALSNRPDLMAQAQEIRAADDAMRAARAEYRPGVVVNGSAGETAIWPTVNYGQLGRATAFTWSAAMGLEWRIFDGGARKNEVAAAGSLLESTGRAAKTGVRARPTGLTRPGATSR